MIYTVWLINHDVIDTVHTLYLLYHIHVRDAPPVHDTVDTADNFYSHSFHTTFVRGI